MTKLIGIATHSESRGLISTHKTIKVLEQTGLEGDYQGHINPQYAVTILSLNSWQDACEECGAEIDWSERRANLLVDHVDFNTEMLGQQIQIGKVLLEITAETDPCSRMDQLQPGLKQALTPNWRGGVRCRVLRAGSIEIGAAVTLLKRL